MNKWWFLAVLVAVALFAWSCLRRSNPGVSQGVSPVAYSSFDEEMAALASEAVLLAKKTYIMNLDYSPESIQQLEELLGLMHEEYLRKREGGTNLEELDEDVRAKGVVWGAYIGEVIKRLRPARWQRDSKHMGASTYPLVYDENDESYPCSWAYKRVLNGPEDNVWNKFQLTMFPDRFKQLDLSSTPLEPD